MVNDILMSCFRAGTFGGLEGTASKYGEHDITGDGALRFFSQLKKVTTKQSRML